MMHRFHRCAVAVIFAAISFSMPARAEDEVTAFARQVNVEPIRLIALQNDGRFKTFDTMAREIVKEITGRTFYERQTVSGTLRQDPVFTFLDLTFNPEAYRELRVIFVKKKPIRDSLVLAAGDRIDRSTRSKILEDGLVSMSFLQLPEVQTKLVELRSDVMKGAKDVDNLQTATELADPQQLMAVMRVIPPPGGKDPKSRWYSIASLTQPPPDEAHAGMMNTPERIKNIDPATEAKLRQDWSEIGDAWRKRDAAKASQAIDSLSKGLQSLAPVIYPKHDKLALEHWYYKTYKMTWTWAFYMIAFIFLLMGIVYRWPRARAVGVGIFCLAFGLHTVACGIRWYLAGRIPNSNMFEAVTAAAWMASAIVLFFEMAPWLNRRNWSWPLGWLLLVGGFIAFVAGLLIKGVPFHEFLYWGPVPVIGLLAFAVGCMTLLAMGAARRWKTHGVLVLAASVASMIAMMIWYFMDVVLDNGMSDIENRMPVLNDVWIYIHTNMIIASYFLVAIACVTAAMYLVGRLLTRPTQPLVLSMLLPFIFIPAISLIPGIEFSMIAWAWSPFAMVVGGYLIASLIRLIWRNAGQRAFETWEGSFLAPAMVSGARKIAPLSPVSGVIEESNPLLVDPTAKKEGLAAILDGATMILLELFFITLWTGLIMGAIWADHSWGRPWGWDPKEVFALNTWIIFLILVHVRIKVQDKALWTAVLAVVGCSVMLFNWVVVNFFITGLHSYA